jgi:hypothetical protein
MANLIVRGVDESLVRALKEQAGLHGVAPRLNIEPFRLPLLSGPRKRLSRRY